MTIGDRDDVTAQLATEWRINQHPDRLINGWQVYAALSERGGRGQVIPAGSYWAGHWELREPLIIATTLAELEERVLARQEQMAAEKQWAERSALNRILRRDEDGA